MMRSTPYRSLLIHIAGAALAAAFVLLPQTAFAQHGGGGHSGGGGGGHFGGGGGGHFSAPSRAPAPSHTSSAPRGNPAPQMVRPPSTSTSGGAAAHPISSAPVSTESHAGSVRIVEPGSNAPAASGDSAAPRSTTIGFPPSSAGNWPPSTSMSTPPSVSQSPSQSFSQRGPLSFSGQGHELWRNSTVAPTPSNSVVARTPESIRGGTPQFQRFPSPPHIITGPRNFDPVVIYPGFGFFGGGFGLFGPFGFGFGCDPFWNFGCDPFSSGYGFGYGYGPGSYGNFGSYGPYAPTGGIQADSSDDSSSVNYGGPSVWRNPPSDNANSPDDVPIATAPSSASGPAPTSPADASSASPAAANSYTVIYLQNGTSFAATDYWVADGKLHYVTSYGGENAVDLSQFDIERTTKENAARGVSVTMRSEPTAQPSPNAQPAPVAQPSPETQPTPATQ